MSTLQALHSSGHCTRYFIIDEWMDANKGIDHLSLCQEKFEHWDIFYSLISLKFGFRLLN